jgi:uncharacterized caspase-like protein
MSGKFALVIGNTEYTDPGLAQLTAPGKDAEDFARVLKDTEIGAFDEVAVLLNQPEYVVREAIDDFFNLKKPEDLLVLYFSGHGVRDELGALYLAVKNTTRSKLRATGIKSDYIREAMDQSRSRRQVLILDCCNSGAFAQGTKAATGVSIGTATAFESGFGRVILTASDSTQFAWEGDKVIGETDNSLFTHYLVEGLEGEADLDGDGRITVDELYDYAYEKVRLATPKQTPSKFSTRQQGEIVLRHNMGVEDIKPAALPYELLDEIEDTRPYVREAAVQKLEKIIKGKNIGMARSAREALEKIATDENTTRRVEQLATQVLESIRQVERVEEETKAAEDTKRLLDEKKAEKDRLAAEQAERRAKAQAKLAKQEAEAQKAEEERIALEKVEAERKAKDKAQRLASQKAEDERIAREKAEAERKAKIEAQHLAATRTKRESLAPEKAKARPEAVKKVNGKEGMAFKTPWLKPATLGIGVIALILFGIALRNYYENGIFGGPAATEALVEATAEPQATEAPTEATTESLATEAPTEVRTVELTISPSETSPPTQYSPTETNTPSTSVTRIKINSFESVQFSTEYVGVGFEGVDCYYTDTNIASPQFWANNSRGIIDLGNLGSIALNQVAPPLDGYDDIGGVFAIIGHVYVVLAEPGHYAVFRVVYIEPDKYITIDFYYF